jgi:peptidoglycan/LPS O-acetylase OafA/YrhL
MAVGFGWLIHRQSDLLAVWGRSWPLHLAAAAVATTVCLSMAGVAPTLAPIATRGAKLAFALSYALAIWCWSLAVVGIAIRFLSHGNATIRYVADASYWIYLVHLPVVAALQILASRLSWHWSVKFPLILVVSLAVLFATYHYLVRSTFVGQFLNGRRYPRKIGRPGSPDDRGDQASGVDGMSRALASQPEPHAQVVNTSISRTPESLPP